MVADADQRVGEVRRPRERHVDAPQHLQRRAALDARRLVELARDGLERLPQQEDAEGARHVRQPDGEDRVLDAERGHRPVVLDDQHVGHDHQLHEHQREQHVAAGELEARERVRGERHQHELRRQHHGHQQHRVEEVACERRRRPRAREVVERQRGRQHEARRELSRVERRPERVEQRQHPQEAQQPRGGGLQRARDAARLVDHRAHGDVPAGAEVIGSAPCARGRRTGRAPQAPAAPAARR